MLEVKDCIEFLDIKEMLAELHRIDRNFDDWHRENRPLTKTAMLERIKELRQLRYDNQSEREAAGFGTSGPF